jgi:polar amino acid transport system substrate-binding protein
MSQASNAVAALTVSLRATRFALALACGASLLCGANLLGVAHAATLSIRADEWSPVNNDPRAANRGIMIEIAEAILADNGDTVDYKIMQWDDALAAVKAGKNDCVVGALKSDIPVGFVTPAEPWVVSRQTVYARSDKDFRVNSVQDLPAFRLGVSGDYSYGDVLDKYRDDNLGDPARIYVARSNRPVRDLLMRLNTLQIQLALETSVVMDYNIVSANLKGRIKAVGTPTQAAEELYIACSAAKPTTAAYMKLFNEGLPRLRANGKFVEILGRYGVTSWLKGSAK